MERPLLISRAEADRILHLDKNTSYRILPKTPFRGMVSWSDIKDIMHMASRNGAVWNGGEVMDLDDINFGAKRKSVLRVVNRGPHFRLSRKTILINKADLLSALMKGEK